MRDIKSDLKTRNLVNHSFQRNAARPGQICDWPVVGGHYVSGEDSIESMIELAVRALGARESFAHNGPPDAQPLPLSHDECEKMKVGGVKHVAAWYSRSLYCRDYDTEKHPSFDDYARGVMASDRAPDFIKNDKQLRKRYPPKKLIGLGPGLVWEPTTLHGQPIIGRLPFRRK